MTYRPPCCLVVAAIALAALPICSRGDAGQPPALTEPTTPAKWGAVTEGLQMSAQIDTHDFVSLPAGGTADSIVVGHLAVLQAVVRNTRSTDGGWMSQGSPENEFTVTVKNSQGQVVPLTQWGRRLVKLSPDMTPSGRFEIIPANRSKTFRFVLNRMYDLSEPGEYTVQIQHWVQRALQVGHSLMVSNTLPFVVTEDTTFIRIPEDVVGGGRPR